AAGQFVLPPWGRSAPQRVLLAIWLRPGQNGKCGQGEGPSATWSGSNRRAEKPRGKALRPFGPAIFERAGGSGNPVVFDGDQLDDPAPRSLIQQRIARMRTANCRYMGGCVWIVVGRAADRAGIDDQRSRACVYHAGQVRVSAQH